MVDYLKGAELLGRGLPRAVWFSPLSEGSWPWWGGSLASGLLLEPPFLSPLDDFRSVRAVKGSLRRFAPWTAAGRSEGMTVYEGKGGIQISQ